MKADRHRRRCQCVTPRGRRRSPGREEIEHGSVGGNEMRKASSVLEFGDHTVPHDRISGRSAHMSYSAIQYSNNSTLSSLGYVLRRWRHLQVVGAVVLTQDNGKLSVARCQASFLTKVHIILKDSIAPHFSGICSNVHSPHD